MTEERYLEIEKNLLEKGVDTKRIIELINSGEFTLEEVITTLVKLILKMQATAHRYMYEKNCLSTCITDIKIAINKLEKGSW